MAAIESLGVLPNATFYSRRLNFDGISLADRKAARGEWLEGAVQAMRGCDLVCVDPDNGLEVRSTKSQHKRGPKYVFYAELLPYVSAGQSVVIYQHLPREAVGVYVGWRTEELKKRLRVDEVWSLRWRPYSGRIYYIIPNGRRYELQPRIESLLSGPWGEHFEATVFP